ncbi:MAG: tripartite tricarboxylate transporter substrate binding protein [Betaproteobacteria bacterium]|nr:tripartite tricarboxylate transporter substrate binding protein [Betaproteobacteria bacterium]
MPSDRILQRRAARTACAMAAILGTLAVAGAAQAQAASTGSGQAYPVKPIRIVVPFAPGGPNDILARLIGQKLTEAWGQQVIVENRPGGGTVIGTEVVARSPPDGYTLLMVSTSHTTNPSLLRKLPYDPVRDLEPVILVASSPNVLVAHPSLPAKSVKELIGVARSRPDQVAYGSGGNGTSTHLAGAMLALMGGVKMIHVPYRGGGPATIDLLSGQITWMFGTILPSMPHIRSGRLRALAVTGTRRAAVLPDVPPVADTLPGFEASSWYGVSASAGTAKGVISKLNQEIAKHIAAPDIRDRLANEGIEVVAGSPEQFGAFYRAEIEKWARVIKAASIKLE